MKFSAINSSVSNQSADCLVLFIRSEENQIQLSSVGQDIDATTEGLLSNLIKREQLSASLGQVDVLFEPYGLKYKQLMLIGLGDAAQLTLPKTRKLLSKVISTLDQRKINHAALSLSDLAHANPEPISNNAQAQLAQFVCEAAHASQYRYTETKSKQSSDEEKTSANALKNITFILEDAANIGSIERSIAIGAAIGAGTDLTKKLSNLPGNVCTPTYLAKTAQTLGKKYGITTTVLDEAKMKKLGMGSLLS
ncbi:MAG: M17 family peptidase N-terminal domain-containing protein, partial [Arenicellales bacterium]